MDDTSLFGSDLAGPPTTGVTGTRGGQTSLFSDSDDLFSSSSYHAPQKYNQKPHTTQSRTPKFDPLFIHNATASALPSFEDSVDGISSDDTVTESQKDIVTNTESDKSKTDPLFQSPLKDDLFNMSTESDISFLPKSNVVENHVSNEQITTQKSESSFDGKSKDDLFSLSTESESSILQKTRNVPKPSQRTTKTDSLFDKKSNDDLFSQSTESDISQKAKPSEDVPAMKNEKSKPDLLFDRTQKDDIFSQSVESDKAVSQKAKPTEEPRTNEQPKSDSLVATKAKDDLFSQSVKDNKATSYKVPVIEDDDDDEDDLFKTNSRPLFSPPPLDFESEVSASGDFTNFTTKGNSKPMNDGIFDDDDDIFSPKSSKKKSSDTKAEKEKTKVDKKGDKEQDSQVM